MSKNRFHENNKEKEFPARKKAIVELSGIQKQVSYEYISDDTIKMYSDSGDFIDILSR